MPGGKGNIKPSDNPKPFTSDNQPEERGRKPSIKKQLQELLLKDGVMEIPAKQVIEVLEDGGVKIKLPKEEMLAMTLMKWAFAKKGNDALKAIQMIMEQMDGKPTQPLANDSENPISPVILINDIKGNKER